MFSDTMMLGGGRKAAYLMENSLLFRGGQHFSRTPSVDALARICAISWWEKGAGPTFGTFFLAGPSNTDYQAVYMASGMLWYEWISGNTVVQKNWNLGEYTSASTAFRHFYVEINSSSGVSFANHVRAWVNGVELGTPTYTDSTGTYANRDLYFGSTRAHWIGRNAGGTADTTAYVAEPQIVSGSLPGVSKFGEVDATTLSWRPKKVAGVTYGTNGCYLGKPWNSASLGADYSGLGNNWTPSGFVASDVVTDTPTNVYATLNPLDNFLAVISEGSLKVTSGSSSYNGARCNYAIPSSGKWYWEVPVINHSGAVGEWISLGITKQGIPLNAWAGANAGSVCYGDRNDGSTGIFVHGTAVLQSTSLAFVTGNVIQVAYNADTGQLWFGKNNLWWNAGATSLTGNPASGQSPTAIVSPGEYFPYIQMAGTSNVVTVNFGQRSFAYTPPAGFKSLCTANLPTTTGQAGGSFTGTAVADGPCIYTGAVPVTLTINNNTVVWGTHADKLATGFKIRTASASYNASGTNNWGATYNKQPTVGSNHTPANAQIN